jgi:hypothetical protein
VRQQLERKASAAINKEYDAARTFANAKSEAHLQKRLQQYDTAHDACEQAITLYDHLAFLLAVRRAGVHLCSPQGQLRTPEGVRSELTQLFDLLAARACPAITQTLQASRPHLNDLLVPLKQAEEIAAALRGVVPHAI